AAEPGDFAILQLPLGWRNSFGVQGAESTQTQYYQTYHHKRLLSGNISRNPPFKFDYFRRQPILESLIALQTYEQVDAVRRTADRATAAEFVTFYDIRYVVVAPGVPGRPPYVDTRDEAVAYVEEVLPVDRVYDEDGWLLYRVEQQPLPASLEIDLGGAAPRTQMALGEGWGGAEEIQGTNARWAVSEQAGAFLPTAGGTGYRLSVEVMPFDYPGAEEQGLTPWINGQKLERVVLAPGWNRYHWDVPASALSAGLAEVRLAFDRVAAPADVLPGGSTIGGTGVEAPLAIEVNSGGPADFAYITLGDGAKARDGSLHGAGYNLAVLDPTTGRLLDRQAFDTTPSGSQAQSAALVAFVEAIPGGQIVVVALQGQGAAHLTAKAVAALHALGGRFDPLGDDPGGQAYSHAIVGVKGAAPGTALEAAGPDNGWLRVAPDRRTLAAAVQTLVWERNE
ncbi:MAG: interleukin-like EMT inducer domain-containing protein, partial [Anaerolineae bacterium]